MVFIKEFHDLSKADVSIAGGKGASLGEMTRVGLPVPPGFVVLASAFEQFLDQSELREEIEALMHGVKHEDINSVEGVSVKIRALIEQAVFPSSIASVVLPAFEKLGVRLVAVRSSATAEDSAVASWAGELESYLNTSRKNLLEMVKKCWSSLFTARAIFYRIEKKLHAQRVSVAVVVQAMIQSEVSGICFTVHPVTKDHGQMVIEAGYGLGEAIVGGKITPDTYIVHKQKTGLLLLDKHISEQRMMIVRGKNGTEEVDVPAAQRGKQKLSDARVIELASICAAIEKHYNSPQDIEWAFDGKKFFVVQSRPITTL